MSHPSSSSSVQPSPSSSHHSVEPTHPSLLSSYPMIIKVKADIFKPKSYLAVNENLELTNVKSDLQDQVV